MLINEVCSIVGLSRKSIRYYEEEGLLNPKRNYNNDYRVYDEDNIRSLRIIKFLRELDVPISDIKKLRDNELSLYDCLNNHLYKIEEQEKSFSKIKDMCMDIIDSKVSYEKLDIDKYSKEMNILNRKGITMKNVKVNHSKKVIGAIISSFIFLIFFLFIIGIITYFQLTEDDKIPWIIYYFLLFIFAFPILGMVWNLIARIKEILGGEEDEASKY